MPAATASLTPLASKATVAPLALTVGEPAGIGPDISLMLAQEALANGWSEELVLLGDLHALDERARALHLKVPLVAIDPYCLPALVRRSPAAEGFPPVSSGQPAIAVWHHPLAAPCRAGTLDVRNAPQVIQLLDSAIQACQQARCAAMVTAPIQKSIICDAGYAGFQGHTEYLAERTATPRVVMMLASNSFRVALATTHLPLRHVSDAITQDSLSETLRILLDALQSDFGCVQPHVLVAGLNPHAGESGHLGHEEITVMEPVIARFRQAGHRITGPLPADTLFQPKYLDTADAVLAMYHDQGLPVLKYASFGQGINITLGLPIIRTSVDHGTALDLAGTGRAHVDSLRIAWQQARIMAQHRQRSPSGRT